MILAEDCLPWSHLRPVVHPRAELKVASLVIKGKVHDVDRTCGPELGWRRPEHVPSVIHSGQASEIPFGVVIGTEISNFD